MSLHAMPQAQPEFNFEKMFSNVMGELAQNDNEGSGAHMLNSILEGVYGDKAQKAELNKAAGGKPTTSEGIINTMTKTVYPRIGKQDRDGQIITAGTVITMTNRTIDE